MGIESEKLVYDYLSRVGDLAQQQGLSSGERMRLVSGLRADIDHRRTTGGADSPAGVKRILSKLGSPADVVAAAGGRPPDPGA
ncbi:HAAS signaling domain-containing protein, partial [Streptomyces yatensis]|uniref:HAAS signaling domain-containing protein n=2 Tax=Streptomyces yatensis TaxID=155177 RepID=UPI003CD0A642